MSTQHIYNDIEDELYMLNKKQNLRCLPQLKHCGKWVEVDGRKLLNLSSNDYMGLATDSELVQEFMGQLKGEVLLFSSSSSRLLTGNFQVYEELEQLLCDSFGTESALIFSSGYHMNTGILPAVSDSHTLILADKLVHASLIDGIRLSPAKHLRFRHQDYKQLKQLVEKYYGEYNRIIIVTESIFSMDGDMTPLRKLVALKKRYDNVLLYVDEAHAIGARGTNGLGLAEEQDCIKDIDFLCGTFGKAMASAGAYLVCRQYLHDYLVNKMRTLIFTTALPPVNIAWTKFRLERLPSMNERRKWLNEAATDLRAAIRGKGYDCPSESHIVPLTVGESAAAVLKATEMQQKGFYVLPVRPPTVPEGTSRLRISLTAAITAEELKHLKENL